MRKKLIGMISLILMGCLILGSFNVMATQTGEVAIGDVAGKPGETIAVPVELESNPGIVSLYLSIGYDTTALKLDSVTDLALIPDYMSGPLENNPFVISWEYAAAVENIESTGTLAILNFTIRENAVPGNYEITVGQHESNAPYDVNLNDVQFTYQSGTVTVEGSKVNPFEDVYENDFYYNPVLWAVGEGITDGWTPTQFAPSMGCTRGQVVTFLWRAAGKPKASNAENPFKDVTENAYYYDAVLWAVEEGITDGWLPDKFAPEMTCTRGQIVTFIWRAADKPEAGTDTCAFTDVAENAYYRDAVLWAVENGITDGWLPTQFAPEMECTRGQIVTFLYRYYN